MQNCKFVIRKMNYGDLDEIVNIHTQAFPDFFLTKLGKGFLNVLYKEFIKDQYSFCFIAENDSKIQGFVVGNQYPEAFFKRLYYLKGFRLFTYTIGLMLRQPVLVFKKLYYAITYRGEKPVDISNATLLSSIAVDPRISSKGIGSRLIETFCEAAFLRGSEVVYLTTDEVSNEQVNSFYIKNGFVLESVFTQANNRIMNRFIRFAYEEVL